MPDRTGEGAEPPDDRTGCSGEESGGDDDALGAFVKVREPVGKARRTLDRGHQRVGDQVAECDAERLDSALQFAEGAADAALHRLGHPLRGTVAIFQGGGVVPDAIAAGPEQGDHARPGPVAEERHGVGGREAG